MPTTHRHQFEASLNELRNALLKMSQAVEKALEDSIKSLKHADQTLADEVIKQDPLINKMEEEIDNIGSTLIATQQPVAKDLRRILVAFKMSSDLERIGDLAVDIAKVTKRIGDEPLIKPLVDIPRMADIVRTMTKSSIEAFLEEDLNLAYQMAKMDDEVDHLHSQILRDTIVHVSENPNSINQVLLLSFVSRYLERMADHATNIGEGVVYLIKGIRMELNN